MPVVVYMSSAMAVRICQQHPLPCHQDAPKQIILVLYQQKYAGGWSSERKESCITEGTARAKRIDTAESRRRPWFIQQEQCLTERK